jgi:hypothetical protein
MRLTGCRYVTRVLLPPDDREVKIVLSDFSAWFDASNAELEFPTHDHDPYTNLFIIDCSFFNSCSLFFSFADAIHRAGCIWINRWGDMPLWSAPVHV